MDSRDKIVRVAFNLFLQKGYKEVSLKEIVDKVGLTKGAFYHYFTGKEKLFREVVDLFVISGGDQVYDGIPRNNLKEFMIGYLERVTAFIDQVQREMNASERKIGVNYFSLTFDALRILPGFAEEINEMHQKERQTWMEVIANAREAEEISTHLSDQQLAKMFIGVNDGIGMHLISEGRVEEVTGEVFTLWNGMYNLIKT